MQVLIGPNIFHLNRQLEEDESYDCDVYKQIFINACVSPYDFLAVSVPKYANVFSVSIEKLKEEGQSTITLPNFQFYIKVQEFYLDTELKFIVQSLELRIPKILLHI